MTPKQVQRRRLAIKKKISDWYKQLDLLREQCEHPNVERSYGANTGNYSPSDDVYWTDYKCPDCGWRHTEYSK